MKGQAALRRTIERLDDFQLERAIEAALARQHVLVERILASVPPPPRVLKRRRRVEHRVDRAVQHRGSPR